MDIPFVMITQANEFVCESVPENVAVKKIEIGGTSLLVVYYSGQLENKIKRRIRRRSLEYFKIDLKFVLYEEEASEEKSGGID